jgi:hypothetical protein
MDKKIGVYVILTLSILFGCETKKDTKLDAQNVTKAASFKGEEIFENKITAIDSDTQLSFLNSLSYNNNEGSTIEVIAYLNKADSEVKDGRNFFRCSFRKLWPKYFLYRRRKENCYKTDIL